MSKFTDWVKKVVDRFKAVFTNFFSPLEKAIKENYGTMLFSVVQTAVGAAEAAGKASGLSGSAKMAVALGYVRAKLMEAGKPFLESVVRGSIEAFLVSVKSKGDVEAAAKDAGESAAKKIDEKF